VTSDPEHHGDGPPKTALELLSRNRAVLAFFLAKTASSTGVWIHNIASAILVYQVSRSTFLVGMVSVVQFSPQVIISPLAGVWADRGNRIRQVVFGRVLAIIGSGVVLITLVQAGEQPPRAELIILMSAFVGVGFGISNPALHAYAPTLVHRRDIRAFVAIDAAAVTIARTAGPALAGALLLLSGPPSAYAAAVIGHLVVIIAFLWLSRVHPEVVRPQRANSSVFSGFEYLLTDRVALLLLVGVVGVGVGVDPVVTLSPAIADILGGGVSLVATLTTTFGLGTVTSPFLLGLLRRRFDDGFISVVGLLLLAVSLMGFAVSPSATGAIAALYLGGIGTMLGITSYTSLLQVRLEDDMRGRVMGIWQVCFVGSRPLAAAFNGWVADAASPATALYLTATLLVVIAVLTRPSQTAQPPPLREEQMR
jgi:MFS family permease